MVRTIARETFTNSQRKEILIELLDRLRSIRERKFDDPADVTVWSRLKSGKMRFHGHGMIFKQDIFLENGRCAWAIEEMLGCKLPEYSEESCNAEEKINKLIDQSYRVILQAMSMPERKKEKPAARQPEQQGEKKFRPKVLDQLPMTLNLWRAGLPVLAVHSNRVLKEQKTALLHGDGRGPTSPTGTDHAIRTVIGIPSRAMMFNARLRTATSVAWHSHRRLANPPPNSALSRNTAVSASDLAW